MKFTLALAAIGISALALATPTRRAPALEISLSAPTSVNSIDDIKVVASVTNTGSEDVKILKYGTVLDSDLPTRSFTVSKDGVDAEFLGVKVQLNAVDALTESAFITIPAGETLTAEHDVSALFNFESLGTGAFTFAPVETFQVIGDDAKLDSFKVSAASLDVDVKSGVARREYKHKRATVSCSTSSYASFISASYTEAKSLASIASSYVSTNGASNTLYKAYFGTTSTSTVISVLNAVANENTSSRTLNCSDPYGVCNGNVIAYTLISGVNPIYYCSIFYNEVATSSLCSGTTVASRNVRGGTTLHELTHATSGTDDIGYGCSYDQSLAASSPSQAAINADNYNCFATQVYQNTQC